MAIAVRCGCGNEWKAGDAARGRSMPCPRCGATVVIGQVAATATENQRLKMALVLVAGGHPLARKEVFGSLKEGNLLLPLRSATPSPAPGDCFFRTRPGARALLAFTDQEELRRWPSARGASVLHLGLPALLDVMNAVGPGTALLINEASLLGLVLNFADVRDLTRGQDPNIPDLRQYVIAGS